MAEVIYQNARISTAAGTAGGCQIAPPTAAAKWAIASVAILVNKTTTANGTNYVSIRGYKGAGTGTPIAAARTTAATDLTVSVPEVVTLTAVGSDLEISQANPLHFEATHTGTGAAPDVTFMVGFTEVRV